MAVFPRIQSPCPYKGDMAAIMDGDMCRLCKRQVFDLTDMGDDDRVAFIRGCTEPVCVSYRLPRGLALAAALATAAAVTPLAAAAECPEVSPIISIGGGITDLTDVEYVELAPDAPDLPVVYEGGE